MAAKREQELRLFELASAKLSEAQKLMAEARDLLKQGLTNVTNARQEKSAIEEITITLNEVHFASTIRLNVGGKIYKTTLDTLRKDPDSILSAMFSGRIELKADEDDGAYFIDLDAELFRDKLKVANEELQKRKAYIDSLEPKVSSSAKKVNELQELLTNKDREMKVMEDRYKKYLEKAKGVIKTLDPKKNAGSQPEVQLLQNQVREKDKIIEQLERDYEKMKITREREEKRAVSAWYEMGIQLHRKAAEERLPGNTGGMSFLAREGQASSPRFSPNRTQQADAVSSRELNQKLIEAESELDDIRNQKSAAEMGKDSELGKNYTDDL